MLKRLLVFAGIVMLAFVALPEIFVHAQLKKQFKQIPIRDGDIIFQSSDSRQCRAIKMATHSDISHCGLLFKIKDEWQVLEAVEPVQLTSLTEFIKRDPELHYTIKRLDEKIALKESAYKEMLIRGKQWIGKHYDIYFNWSNAEIYCSELVWKLYHDVAGIDLCATRQLKDFDLDHELVRVMMKERYGDKVPYQESVVAPSDIYHSTKLITVAKQ